MRSGWISTAIAIAFAPSLATQVYVPIPVTGYNQDVIADAGGPAMATTTASFDSPILTSPLQDNVLYQEGYNTAAPTVGVPANGQIIVSASRSFRLGPISGNNSLQMTSDTKVGMLTLVVPQSYSALSVLLADGNGVQAPSGGRTGTLSVNWSNSTATVRSYTVNDWFLLSPWTPGPNTGVAISGLDRARRDTGAIQNTVPNPVLFYWDIDLSMEPAYLAGAMINSVTFNWPGGPPTDETTNVMGLSGVSGVPEPSALALVTAAAVALLRMARRAGRRNGRRDQRAERERCAGDRLDPGRRFEVRNRVELQDRRHRAVFEAHERQADRPPAGAARAERPP